MKRTLLLALAFGFSLSAMAQAPEQKAEGYTFTDTKIVPTTPIKDQYRSGTCWCFSALGFLESEIIRAGGEQLDLSEMWIVRNIYFEKAVKYARLHGHLNLAVGGQAYDVTNGIMKYGIVPQEVYPGLNYGSDKPFFAEIDAIIKAYMDAVIVGNQGGKLSTAWQRGLNAILDQYFGVMPEKFTYKGKEYTPKSYAASLPINMADYVSITSFTHHPFYTKFIMEIPDNWTWESIYNVPMEEMMSVVDNALANNYTIEWSTDVSEKGFDRMKAIGIIPETDLESMDGTEAEKWGKLTAAEKNAALYSFTKPGKEKHITQQMRQDAFDNYETTDDHGMEIMGTAVDQIGNPYFKVKNSWSTLPPYAGFYYFSRPFVAAKTITIMVNKNAVPKDIRKKLSI
ncbi:MAG: C1 family peptidase [Alistipes sp.]